MLEHLFSGSVVNLAGTRQHLGARHRSLAQESQELGEFAHSCGFWLECNNMYPTCRVYSLYQLPSPSKVSLKPVVPDLV